jgi:DNA-directed RNA polymerase specialized sigma24 family protein
MARLLDRVKAEELLADNLARCQAASAAKAGWDASLVERSDSWLAANEGGLLVQEIAEHCGCSVGLVKLEIGKAKARREKAV